MRKHHQLADIDYSSIEGRIAEVSRTDPAKIFAAEMLNKPYDEVTHEERQKAKNHPLFWLNMYGNKNH